MKLNKIKLKNIRSYVNSEINFPESISLLAGDIGSGKSSILLAIDFALFGIRRGELSGNSLLRNGEDSGSVELYFGIDDKEIVIKRTLKREKESVVQSSGYIIVNNKKKEGTAVELKQMILDLLNYPKELLMKSKSLIYRYTVYTPQEEMKQILLGEKDYRLDTLRRVFGIDKYKRIRDNANIYTTYLNGKRKELAGKIFDLEEKKKLREERSNETKEKKDSIREILPKIGEVDEKLKSIKKELDDSEKEVRKFRNLEKEYENAKVSLVYKNETKKNSEEELIKLEEDIKRVSKSLTGEEFDEARFEKIKKEVSKLDKKVNEFRREINEARARESSFEENKERISKLEKCPTCGQDVPKEYKLKSVANLDKEIHKLSMIAEEKSSLLNEELKKLENLRNEYEMLREKEAKAEALKLKKQNLTEKENRRKKLLIETEKLGKEIDKLKMQENSFKNELLGYSSLEEKITKLRKNAEIFNEEKNQLEIEKAGVEREIKSIIEQIKNLDEEIEKKLKIKEELIYSGKMQEWLEKYFMEIVNIIERKVMLRVHSEFNNWFKKWFDMLIENELMDVSLDEEFTPKIEQNGHDIDYLYLSGGEKTAAALAYRLALNQVINSLVSVIKTKDLLILDEPTDGFSYEQLERMEKVLHELDIKQIILVSHESRIEGFVDSIVKLKKEGHVTEVIP